MRNILIFLSLFLYFASFGQDAITFPKDTLIIVGKNSEKGFHNDYILFIPKGTPLFRKTYLLVEPNNTGKTSDNMELHKKYAIDLATVSSVGNNVSKMLKIPLLVPIFPRPASHPLIYTHALDREAIVDETTQIKRLDLQLLHMIENANRILSSMNIIVDPQIFMNGFSASATFTNRFSFIHPEKIKALAIGGFNGKLMLPKKKINGVKLNYPLGINDYSQFDRRFDKKIFKTIPKFIYMGKMDDNDAVQFDDAYSNSERKIINENLGSNVQDRYLKCRSIYEENDVIAIFKNYEDVGHWTTSEINLEVIKFFGSQMETK